MSKAYDFNMCTDLFSSEKSDDVILLHFNKDLLFKATDLSNKDLLLNFFEHIAADDRIKVIVIISSPHKSGKEEYLKFYNDFFSSRLNPYAIHRLCNVFKQLIVGIVEMNKMCIHANSGQVISLLLNVSLACDYRIIADDTVFINPYLDQGLVPIGGGPYFLSKRLGSRKAQEILLFRESISAKEALEYGFVDEVVPIDRILDSAKAMARRFCEKPFQSVSGIKRLLNYSLQDLKDYLDFESQELHRIVLKRKPFYI